MYCFICVIYLFESLTHLQPQSSAAHISQYVYIALLNDCLKQIIRTGKFVNRLSCLFMTFETTSRQYSLIKIPSNTHRAEIHSHSLQATPLFVLHVAQQLLSRLAIYFTFVNKNKVTYHVISAAGHSRNASIWPCTTTSGSEINHVTVGFTFTELQSWFLKHVYSSTHNWCVCYTWDTFTSWLQMSWEGHAWRENEKTCPTFSL